MPLNILGPGSMRSVYHWQELYSVASVIGRSQSFPALSCTDVSMPYRWWPWQSKNGNRFYMSESSVLTQNTIETIEWTRNGVVMIDQTRLPRETVFVTCRNYVEVADAIRTMIIR